MQPDSNSSNQTGVPSIPNAEITAVASQQPAMAIISSTTPPVADDADIIETEWVETLKRTIDQHKHDPYVLSQALMALRRDYLQKRYGKTIEAAK